MNADSIATSDCGLHDAEYHEDNGFSSRQAMERSHAPIIAYALEILKAEGGRMAQATSRRRHMSPAPTTRRVLDLGCGNGALVGTIARLCPVVIPAGVDVAATRIERARRLWPAGEFVCGNLFDADFPDACDLAIVMLGRLIEVPRHRVADLFERLRRGARVLLVYAYQDYLEETMPFAALARRLGLALSRPIADNQVSLALAFP